MAGLLDAELLGRFRTLDLVARGLVEGFITGLHRSPYHGFSVEFSQHRPYMPGDDTRHIDWKLYGRTGRYHIKQFEEETNLRASVLLDCSASMGYGSGSMTKFRYGTLLASCLMYLMIRQRDAAGLVLFDEKMRQKLPPRSVRSYLNTLLSAMENQQPSEGTRIADTLHIMAESLRRRGLVVLISDLFDDEEQVIHGLRHFRHGGHEVIVFQILDPAELDFGRLGAGRYQDMETRELLSTDPRQVRDAVNREVRAFVSRIKDACHADGIDHVLVDTSRDFDSVLLEYLIKRRRLA
ncbi:MAG: DUF58 domain-containing protein [Calditrichaeota bacterium]|nr:DUF58 domain-containing protein [Candidatus Cloacimonadota bacterium]MCB1047100.1 DUF58 domain-containing protein [Calditrichota bacterium]MCB9474258.1 DUF58 domain-containing protein [Candidatus Delongbacteria bacterium]